MFGNQLDYAKIARCYPKDLILIMKTIKTSTKISQGTLPVAFTALTTKTIAMGLHAPIGHYQTPRQWIMALASVAAVSTSWAAPSATVITAPTQTPSAASLEPNVIPRQNTPSDDNLPYQYPLHQQPVEDKIAQQLNNQTLTEFDNFNQPTATLTQHQPTLGYDKTLELAASPNKTPNPTTKPQQQAQVIDQLTTQNQTTATLNNQVSPSSNQANQTADIDANDTINPNDYLPEYQQQTTATTAPQTNTTVTADPQGVVARLKNKLLSRGEGINYIDVTFANADAKLEPAKNIKAALEKVTVESVADFNASVNKLRRIAKDAAEAVGYYDTTVGFRHLGGDNIEVSLNVGAPVIVTNRHIDVRGEGGKGDKALPVYPAIEQEIPPKVGDTFNHGVYKNAKATIEGVAKTNGYFDAKWLNSSADIILPDNSAEVDLIFDTQQRYHFDTIKIYSIDKEGRLTDDPNQLPLKPKLLKALMPYQKGDPYYQPFVTEFTNNLTATRYFNGIDVDVVMPSDEAATEGIDFKNSSTMDSATAASERQDQNLDDSQTNQAEALLPEPTQTTKNTAKTTKNSSERVTPTHQKIGNQKAVNQVQNPEDIAPLQFAIDDSTEQRLNAISRKAKSLLSAPEDMELSPETNNNSKNPLVIIANTVSKVAKKLDKNEDLPIQPREGEVIPKQTPQQVYAEKQIPTYVVLNATKPHEAQIGLGYETDVGARVVGKYSNNLVNRSGLQTGITLSASKVDQAIELNASLPYKHPLNDKLTGTVGYEHKKVDDIINTFEADTVYATIARNIYHDSGWNRTYSLRYRGDELSVDPEKFDTDSLPYPFNNHASDYTQQALLAGYALNKTVADNLLAPTYGYSQRYSIEVGAKGLLSDTNMAILRAGASGMYSFGKDKKQQVLGRLDLGYLYSGDFYDVPYRSRFFAGGDQSIRGFNTDSLAPTYGEGKFLVGGNALAVGSAEYNYEFRPSLRGALFTDFGNAYDLDKNYTNTTEVSIGAGVRWKSPIGLVRFDVAKGLTGDNNSLRLHFFIGSPL